MTQIAPPVLSVFDPHERAEGSIDPLGLMANYERLAERIFPWLTVRMQRPRFLTAMVVGAHVCEGFAEELAADSVTPAWMVYEWHVVEAFVRQELDESYPGKQKAGGSLRKGHRLSKDTYLKTGKVFGFTGVYRRLSRGLEILDDDHHLDEGGLELLHTWEREQGLKGFVSERKGAGAEFRDAMRQAVRRGLSRGFVDQPGGWRMWPPLTDHLRPDRMRKREAECIARRLFRTDLKGNRDDVEAQMMRRELLEHLERHGKPIDRATEHRFFRRVIRRASGPLQERLACIDAYEGLGRILEDAFRYILFLSSEGGSQPVAETDFAGQAPTHGLAERLPGALERLEAAFAGSGWEHVVQDNLQRYQGVKTPAALYDTVLEQHEEAQRRKPPDGKRPWTERLPRGAVVRPMYRTDVMPLFDDRYVYDYRMGTASQFLTDLRRLGQ